MSTAHDLLANIALRIGAFEATLPDPIEAAYLVRPLVATAFDSADFPFSAIIESLVTSEFNIAQTVANTRNHPWRSWLNSVTASLANKANIPTVDASSVPIIGVWSGVYDATTTRECHYATYDYVDRISRNANSWVVVGDYAYNADTDRLLHTRTNVKVKCCVYDRATRVAAITADGAMLMPSVPDELYISGAVSTLSRDDAFGEQAVGARKFFESGLMSITTGQYALSQGAP